MPENEQSPDVAALTVQLLSAYLSNNSVPSEGLSELIRSTKAALMYDSGQVSESVESENFTPAVSARKSLASPDFIISLVDGKPYKTLKRHLAANGLTPDTYRSRYNLPASYPMVAPTYAAHRRAVAQKIGLGSRRLGAGGTASKAVQSSERFLSVSAGGAEGGAPKSEKLRGRSSSSKKDGGASKSSDGAASKGLSGSVNGTASAAGKSAGKAPQARRTARGPKA